MGNRDWEIVKQFYVDTFDVPENLVDLVASDDVLLMCVSGASNNSISDNLNVDIDAVKDIISTVLSFDGWDSDLNINPYYIYTNMRVVGAFTVADFSHEINSTSSHKYSQQDINTMYSICSIYYDVEKRIDDEWV